MWGWPSCHSAALGAALVLRPRSPPPGVAFEDYVAGEGLTECPPSPEEVGTRGQTPGVSKGREMPAWHLEGSGDRRQGPSGSPGMLILESCGKGSGDSSPLQKAIPSQGIRSSHRRELGRRGELGGRSGRVPKKANPGGIDPAELIFFSCLGLCGVFLFFSINNC